MSLEIELAMQHYQWQIVGLLLPVTFILGNCLGLTEYSQHYGERKVHKITVGCIDDEWCMTCHCYWLSSTYKLNALFQVTVRLLLHSLLSDIRHVQGPNLVFCLDNLEHESVPKHYKLFRQIGVNADFWSRTEILTYTTVLHDERKDGGVWR